MENDSRGTIVTFYSYKGGTGRSMALANVAWILASNGRRVLAIDWDLEAPGLHRYYRPFLIDPELSSTPGLIDFFCAYATATMTPRDTRDDETTWWQRVTDLDPFTVQLDWEFPDGGCLDLVPAGRQDAHYAERVNGFDWTNFYRRLDGEVMLQAVRERLREYDFVLIDSRTGVSDTAGICTVAMPDRLVALFTLNRQSMDGVAAVLDSIQPQRQARALGVFPVITRVELAEKDRLEAARRRARARFAPYVERLQAAGSRSADYWSGAEVLYQPYYAYEEVLATFGDPSGENRSPSSLLSAMEALAPRVAGVQALAMPPLPESMRQKVLGQFGGAERIGAKLGDTDAPEERVARAERYLEKDLLDPVGQFTARARAARVTLTVLSSVIVGAGMGITLFMIFMPRPWQHVSAAWTAAAVIVAVLIALLTVGYEVLQPQADSLAARLLQGLTLLGIAGECGFHFWVAIGGTQQTAAKAPAATTSFPMPVVIVLCLCALFAQVFAYRYRPTVTRLRRASGEVGQEVRMYAHGSGRYAEAADGREAWQRFVQQIEGIVASVGGAHDAMGA